MRPKTVAVLFGGRSNEHEISVITGILAANLLRQRYRVLPVYLPKEGGFVTGPMRSVHDITSKKFKKITLAEGGFKRGFRHMGAEIALNCCHGGAGENGTLAALLDWFHIPSASPSLPECAVFMDKTLSKIAARGLGLPVLPSIDVTEEEFSEDEENVLRRACAMGAVVVKPARLGSSIGVRVARGETELKAALLSAFRLDGCVLIEKYLTGKRDLNCAACRLGGETVLSPVEEPLSSEEILTFAEKYEENASRRSVLPARVPSEVSEAVVSHTRLLYESFRMRGVVRADFLLGEDGRVYFNELNTVPGSLSCYLFGESLSSSRDFLCKLIEEGLQNREKPREIVSTGVLSSRAFTGAKLPR